jgi:acylphosphatase
MLKTISITVYGRVQGVFFRHTTRETAQRLKIKGEVCNQPDGSVFILATGTPDALEQFLDWCRQGPPKARVDKVEVKELPLQSFEGFSIRRN